MKDLWKNQNFQPMLLKEIAKPFNSPDYLFELKFDGIRAIIFVSPTTLKIQSRNQKDLTYLFPELFSLQKIVTKKTIFDGEIILEGKNGPSFSKLQHRLLLKNKNMIKHFSEEDPVKFMVFDILYEEKNLISKTLEERKEILNKFEDTKVFIKSKVFDGKGIKLFAEVKKRKLEGIVAKKKDGLYYVNKRCAEFIKIKNIQRDKFQVIGYIPTSGYVISLLLGEIIDGQVNYLGKVVMSKKNQLYEKLINSKKVKKIEGISIKKAVFLQNYIPCWVEYLEKTASGSLRHPVFKGECKDEE